MLTQKRKPYRLFLRVWGNPQSKELTINKVSNDIHEFSHTGNSLSFDRPSGIVITVTGKRDAPSRTTFTKKEH